MGFLLSGCWSARAKLARRYDHRVSRDSKKDISVVAHRILGSTRLCWLARSQLHSRRFFSELVARQLADSVFLFARLSGSRRHPHRRHPHRCATNSFLPSSHPMNPRSPTSRDAPTGHNLFNFISTSLQPRRWAHIKRWQKK